MTTEQSQSTGETKPAAPAKPAKLPRRTVLWATVALVIALVVLALVYVPALRAWIPGIDYLMGEEGGTDTAVEEELAAFDSALSSLSQRQEVQDQRLSNLAEEVVSHGTALAGLESRVSALEGRGGSAVSTGAAPSNIAGRIDMLSARIGQLESAFVPLREKAQSAIDAADAMRDDLAARDRLALTVNGLEDRLSRLEHLAAADNRAAIIAIAFSAVREVANRGRPFSVEYETLHGLLVDANRDTLAGELRSIAPYAASGAPTLAMLRASFADAIAAILEAAKAPDDASWWRKFTAKLSSIVTLRPTGELAGIDADAIVARMERRLGGNDLAGALQEFAALPPSAQEAASAWATDARKRAALDEALAAFAASLLRDVSTGAEERRPDEEKSGVE